jgi:hypothetical protein
MWDIFRYGPTIMVDPSPARRRSESPQHPPRGTATAGGGLFASSSINKTGGIGGNNSNSYNRISNPRWRRYCFLLLSSLIQFAAVANVRHDNRAFSWWEWGWAVQFGLVLFVFSGVSLCTRFRNDDEDNDNKNNKNKSAAAHGKKDNDESSSPWEGYWLVAAVCYSLAGAAVLTRVGAIGYVALNVYFAAWLTVVAAVVTLNQWSTDRDLLSIDELTSLSFTLKSWWMLLLMGIVTAGTSLNYWLVQQRGLFGVAIGAVSAVTAAFFISTHYNLIQVGHGGCCFAEGGWAELFAIVGLCILWTIATAVITQESGIGATIAGSKRLLFETTKRDDNSDNDDDDIDDCVVQHRNETIPCAEWIAIHTEEVPGSNLYLSSWISLLAAVHLVARWKAQQALHFADARQQEHDAAVDNDDDYSEKGDDDDDDSGNENYGGGGGRADKRAEDVSISRDSTG